MRHAPLPHLVAKVTVMSMEGEICLHVARLASSWTSINTTCNDAPGRDLR